jgi:hypothetical protein
MPGRIEEGEAMSVEQALAQFKETEGGESIRLPPSFSSFEFWSRNDSHHLSDRTI